MATLFSRLATSLCAGALLSSVAAAADDLFPFALPWDDATPGITNISNLLEKPAGSHGFVTAQNGHLFAGEKRVRFFGVNLAFGGNFPTHPDAEKVAARMAKFGINCVRFHHMDTSTAPAGILQKDRRTLDPDALDRLDHLIAELKKNGIYTNLNLHVGNPYADVPKYEGSGYFKGVDNFFPELIEQQRAYAKALLTHVNPYTKLAYTADPAVAFVEINNENGLIMEWNGRSLDAMPDPYAAEFSKQWNAWLSKKYATPEKLAAAWKGGEQPLGPELLAAGKWNLETHQGAEAGLANGHNEGTPNVEQLQLEVNKTAKEGWHVQLTRSLPPLEAKAYTLRFRAKADAPRKVSVALGQAHEPWKTLASQQLTLTTEWKDYEVSLSSTAAEERGRVSISGFGTEKGRTLLESVSLQAGGVAGLREGEHLGSVGFFRKAEIGRRTAAAQKDWQRFLFDTEAAYWPAMAQYIKSELGSKSLVLGSATGFSPWPVQAMLDVVDAHAYWQHPHFPGKQWDMSNWTVKNEPMAGREDGGTLPGLALRRVAGKPFIVTEYNHASPNTFSSEAFLDVMSFAALQDWDGVFAFAYCHRSNDWDTKRLTSFFDIDQHPAKMATLPAALALFYRADLTPPTPPHVVSITPEQAIESVAKGGSWVDGKAYGLTREEAFLHPIAFHSTPGQVQGANVVAAGARPYTWDTAAHRLLIATPRNAGVVGSVKAGEAIELGAVKITPGGTRQSWATITATVMQGDDFKGAQRILITATGYVENSDMQWKNAEKTSVTSWGKGTSVVEGISATVTLPARGKLKAWALDEKGQRRAEVPLERNGNLMQLKLSPEQKTLWWEVAPE